MSKDNRPIICDCCKHSKVCMYKKSYQSFLKTLEISFEKCKEMEDKEIPVVFNDPGCENYEGDSYLSFSRTCCGGIGIL